MSVDFEKRHGLWVSLRQEEVAEIEGLQRLAYGTLVDRDLFKPAPPGFFESVIGGRGSVLGRRLNGRLIAFGTLLTGLKSGDGARSLLGLGAEAPLAMMQGVVVDPTFRGHRLHRRLLRRRLSLLRPAETWHVYASAAPGNTASWSNMLAEGYQVADVGVMYGRLLRYTLHRPPQPNRAAATDPDLVWADPLDEGCQRDLISRGARGVALRLRGDRAQIGYRCSLGANQLTP